MCSVGCNHPKMKSWGLLALRVALGVIFILHGWFLLNNHEMAVGLFSKVGIPAANVAVYLVGVLELAGGLMVLLGIMAGFAAMWLAVIMLVALLTVHRGMDFFPGQFGPAATLGGLLALIGTGAGRYRLMKQECRCKKCRGGSGGCDHGGDCHCGGGKKDGDMKNSGGCTCGGNACPECGPRKQGEEKK
jgi:putative oxidoreductase